MQKRPNASVYIPPPLHARIEARAKHLKKPSVSSYIRELIERDLAEEQSQPRRLQDPDTGAEYVLQTPAGAEKPSEGKGPDAAGCFNTGGEK